MRGGQYDHQTTEYDNGDVHVCNNGWRMDGVTHTRAQQRDGDR